MYEHAGWASSKLVERLEKQKLIEFPKPHLLPASMHGPFRSFFRALRSEVPRRLATGELSAKAKSCGHGTSDEPLFYRVPSRNPQASLSASRRQLSLHFRLIDMARVLPAIGARKQAGLLEPEDREARQLVKQLSAAVASRHNVRFFCVQECARTWYKAGLQKEALSRLRRDHRAP